MKFSNRTPENLSHNAITRTIETAQIPFYDLTQSNPTKCGFHYPDKLLQGLSRPESFVYEPDAFGMLKARKALARYLSSIGHAVQPENLVLTASTSEAYSFLLKLLGNPGDSFLVPRPGYPLFDHLLELEGLRLIPYSFQIEPGWPIDLKALEGNLNSLTKGIITVNPHNPTGVFLSENDQNCLLDLCEKQSLAYISDEVFRDYAYGVKPGIIQNGRVLSFRLGGLSKSLGLPQLKLSWIEIQGPLKLMAECKDRLELIADTYLSVNTPVQIILEDLLVFVPDIQKQIQKRVFGNRKTLEKALEGLQTAKIWPSQGGWYALVEVLVEGVNDETLVIELLKNQKVLVQPGCFYDFPTKCFLVLSLLPQTEFFQTGISRLRDFLRKLN